MWGVIGGDAVDRAVEEGFEDGVAVGGGAEGWVHFGVGVVRGDGVFGEKEVVRGGFAGDVEALLFSVADEPDGGGGGDVLDVQVGAEVLGPLNVAEEVEVAGDDVELGGGGIAA